MGKKLTNDEFLTRLKEAHGDKYIALDKYVNNVTKIKTKCNICGFIWLANSKKLYNGQSGCPECGKIKAKNVKKWNLTQNDFLGRLPKEILDKIEIFGEYKGFNDRIKVGCKKCNFKWQPKTHYLYKGQGCERCGRERKGLKSRKSHDTFVKEVNDFSLNSIKIIGNYTTGDERIEVQCNICEHIWNPVASRLLRRGCPKCCSSKGERKIEKILIENNIKFEQQYYFQDLKGGICKSSFLRYDFAIFDGESLLHLIEYDGMQHFKPIKYLGGEERFKRQKELDKMKNDYCIKNNIKLIRISYNNYSKINLEMLMK